MKYNIPIYLELDLDGLMFDVARAPELRALLREAVLSSLRAHSEDIELDLAKPPSDQRAWGVTLNWRAGVCCDLEHSNDNAEPEGTAAERVSLVEPSYHPPRGSH